MTIRNSYSINRDVRSVLSALLGLGMLAGWSGEAKAQATPAKGVPQQVLDGAEAAAKILGQQVLKGNFSFSIQRMYPRWKRRAAMRVGGEDKLAQRLMDIPEQMRKKGITMLSFEALKPKTGHEVFLGRGQDEAGKPIQMYLEWLVFVPTRAQYRVIDPSTGQAKKIETRGFQVAVVKKGTNQWYFIDGSNLTIPELRSFFPGLPEDQALLGLPTVGGGELK